MPTEHAQMHAGKTPYKCLHFSILSDLKKTTAVVESLSTTSTRCSVTEISSLLQDSILLVIWSCKVQKLWVWVGGYICWDVC